MPKSQSFLHCQTSKACNCGFFTGSMQKQQQLRDIYCDTIKFDNISFVTHQLETLKVDK